MAITHDSECFSTSDRDSLGWLIYWDAGADGGQGRDRARMGVKVGMRGQDRVGGQGGDGGTGW